MGKNSEFSWYLSLFLRLLKIADEVCSPDVVLVVHDCSSLTSWKDALVKISLTTPGYDIYNRYEVRVRGQNLNPVSRWRRVEIPSDSNLFCQTKYILVPIDSPRRKLTWLSSELGNKLVVQLLLIKIKCNLVVWSIKLFSRYAVSRSSVYRARRSRADCCNTPANYQLTAF